MNFYMNTETKNLYNQMVSFGIVTEKEVEFTRTFLPIVPWEDLLETMLYTRTGYRKISHYLTAREGNQFPSLSIYFLTARKIF